MCTYKTKSHVVLYINTSIHQYTLFFKILFIFVGGSIYIYIYIFLFYYSVFLKLGNGKVGAPKYVVKSFNVICCNGSEVIVPYCYVNPQHCSKYHHLLDLCYVIHYLTFALWYYFRTKSFHLLWFYFIWFDTFFFLLYYIIGRLGGLCINSYGRKRWTCVRIS